MRYFLITFNVKGLASLGNILIDIETFPSKSYIQQLVSSMMNSNVEVVVINIFEFKNEQDYKNFER